MDGDDDMSELIYAGVGARETPLAVCGTMQLVAAMLATKGWRLRSGRAERTIDADPNTGSADIAFERGCDSVGGAKTIRIPSIGPLIDGKRIWIDHAAQYHPNWSACNEHAQACHARNSGLLLGDYLNEPVHFGICWTPGGAVVGGTGQTLRVAAAYGIGFFNLATEGHEAAMWSYIAQL
jgi:hypothetical protein